MNERCDQLPNCRDKSDESGCQLLLLEQGYNKEIPPVESNKPVNISISLDILKLVDIDEPDYSIEIQFKITLNWNEKRATYHNLKTRNSLNALSEVGSEPSSE